MAPVEPLAGYVVHLAWAVPNQQVCRRICNHNASGRSPSLLYHLYPCPLLILPSSLPSPVILLPAATYYGWFSTHRSQVSATPDNLNVDAAGHYISLHPFWRPVNGNHPHVSSLYANNHSLIVPDLTENLFIIYALIYFSKYCLIGCSLVVD